MRPLLEMFLVISECFYRRSSDLKHYKSHWIPDKSIRERRFFTLFLFHAKVSKYHNSITPEHDEILLQFRYNPIPQKYLSTLESYEIY